MPQSLSQVLLHLVFSTKGRAPYLQDNEVRSALHGYLVGACNNRGCPSIQTGGVADHVHILCRFSKTITIADLIRELKRESSKWIKEKYPTVGDFHWQSGYAAFSLSPVHVQPLVSYIQTQEEHHQKESFQDELRRVMRQCGVEWDERYVWD
jgi:REP element-mobilizing transposase RayT